MARLAPHSYPFVRIIRLSQCQGDNYISALSRTAVDGRTRWSEAAKTMQMAEDVAVKCRRNPLKGNNLCRRPLGRATNSVAPVTRGMVPSLRIR